jgi:hypothetical protein
MDACINQEPVPLETGAPAAVEIIPLQQGNDVAPAPQQRRHRCSAYSRPYDQYLFGFHESSLHGGIRVNLAGFSI